MHPIKTKTQQQVKNSYRSKNQTTLTTNVTTVGSEEFLLTALGWTFKNCPKWNRTK